MSSAMMFWAENRGRAVARGSRTLAPWGRGGLPRAQAVKPMCCEVFVGSAAAVTHPKGEQMPLHLRGSVSR